MDVLTPHELLADLRARSLRVWADGDALHVVPRASLTPEDAEAIRANKPALMALLAPDVASLPDDEPVVLRWPDTGEVALVMTAAGLREAAAWNAMVFRRPEEKAKKAARGKGQKRVFGEGS